ncbi:hypothetical protein JYK02_36770 [Corallococcus macrosporus]|uniref:Uncharacterized protein n=1 Tax=Corallococcus macrosporus TaxID=35 RepID=A0ABS3DP19_9BACT|nr:hypothetical protein [Corallococcus macrosporus]MBN8233083.1 hypothetical protein [Corallococcus macrosporus]
MLTKLLSRPLTLAPAPKPVVPAALPLKPAPIQNTAVRAFQGTSGFESARPAKPLLPPLPPLLPGDLGKLINPRRAAVEEALETGKTVPFTNTDGKTEQVSVTQLPPGFAGGGDDVYVVTVGDDRFTVRVEEGADADAEAVLAQVIDSYSETPEDLRGSLERVVIKKDPDPDNAAARAGDGTITFYNGGEYVTDDIFHHEIGHLIGRQVENANDTWLSRILEQYAGEPPPIPDGWAEAAAADGNHLNEYTEDSFNDSGVYTEDFAEAWSEYMRALDGGPKALAEFERTYPGRSEILEDIYPPPA